MNALLLAAALEAAFATDGRFTDRRDFANYFRGYRDLYGFYPF